VPTAVVEHGDDEGDEGWQAERKNDEYESGHGAIISLLESVSNVIVVVLWGWNRNGVSRPRH